MRNMKTAVMMRTSSPKPPEFLKLLTKLERFVIYINVKMYHISQDLKRARKGMNAIGKGIIRLQFQKQRS